MDDRIVTVHVYRDNILVSSTQIFSQWLNIVTGAYVEYINSPYTVVIEHNGKSITVTNISTD